MKLRLLDTGGDLAATGACVEVLTPDGGGDLGTIATAVCVAVVVKLLQLVVERYLPPATNPSADGARG